MAQSKEHLKQALDWARLILAMFAFVLIMGQFLYDYLDWIYPLNVNLIVTYLLAGYVMLTGLGMYLRKTNKTMGLFLMLCGLITMVVNMMGEVFSK